MIALKIGTFAFCVLLTMQFTAALPTEAEFTPSSEPQTDFPETEATTSPAEIDKCAKYDNGSSQKCKEVNGKVYVVHYRTDNWYEAQRVCRRANGNLATLSSIDEVVALYDLLNIYPPQSAYSYPFWVSGYCLGDPKRTWYSVGSGYPLNFTMWGCGKPDNSGGDDDCVEMARYSENEFFSWNDDQCLQEKYFICEMN